MDYAKLFSFLASGLLFFIPPVMGLIPPYSEEELVKEADVIVEGQVLGVIKVEEWKEKQWKYERFNAWFLVTKAHKGEIKAPQTLQITWQERDWTGEDKDRPVGGGYQVPYHTGEFVKTHLKYGENRKSYYTVHWNGKEKMDMPKEAKEMMDKISMSLECK